MGVSEAFALGSGAGLQTFGLLRQMLDETRQPHLGECLKCTTAAPVQSRGIGIGLLARYPVNSEAQ